MTWYLIVNVVLYPVAVCIGILIGLYAGYYWLQK